MTLLIAFLTAHLAWLVPLVIGGGGLGALALRIGLPALRAKVSANHNWLILLGVAAVAAAIYVWGAEAARDRAKLLAWRERICAAAGVNVRAPGFKAGDCSGRVIALAKLERDSLAASNAAMGDALAEGRRKAGTDLTAARAIARDARAAAESMERANGTIGKDDRVGGEWFAALNRAGGLRDPAR